MGLWDGERCVLRGGGGETSSPSHTHPEPSLSPLPKFVLAIPPSLLDVFLQGKGKFGRWRDFPHQICRIGPFRSLRLPVHEGVTCRAT